MDFTTLKSTNINANIHVKEKAEHAFVSVWRPDSGDLTLSTQAVESIAEQTALLMSGGTHCLAFPTKLAISSQYIRPSSASSKCRGRLMYTADMDACVLEQPQHKRLSSHYVESIARRTALLTAGWNNCL